LPESAESFRLIAETNREQGRHAEAAAAWREALRLAPTRVDLQRELAASLMDARQYADAQKILDGLLKAEPEAADLQHLQGDLLLGQQLPAKAIPFLDKAVKRNPRLLPARASLARALLADGKPALALPHVTAALPIDADGSLQFQLARAYQASGQAELAAAAMKKYQEIKAKSRQQDQALEEELQITAPATTAK
jgi:predicted Zn-dependent protease